MGETSAKSLRGSGMEDVIFNGTSNRPSKNICEVSIKLENDANSSQFRGMSEIEIKRKLEKDKGSKYYINGKEVRAKDVQILFADLSIHALQLLWTRGQLFMRACGGAKTATRAMTNSDRLASIS